MSARVYPHPLGVFRRGAGLRVGGGGGGGLVHPPGEIHIYERKLLEGSIDKISRDFLHDFHDFLNA